MTLKIFLKKIVRKLFKLIFRKNLFSFPIGENSPYYINAKNSNSIQNGEVIILNMPTSDNFRQAIHPDVIYLEKGFGLNNHRFWMACTPYPNQDDRYENPEIFSSENGFFWKAPQSNTNPLFKKPKDFLSHNSDTAIVYNGNKLVVFFRTSYYEKNGKNKNLIQSIESDDGVHWSNLQILMESDQHFYLSPSIKKIKNEWIMWTVDYNSKNRNRLSIYRRVSKDLINWNSRFEVNCEGLPQIIFPWHVGVEIVDEKILCILTSCTKFGGKNPKNWMAASQDLGFSFKILKGFENKYDFESWFQYRASIVDIGQKDKVQIFYTAVDKKNICHIARKEQLKSDFGI